MSFPVFIEKIIDLSFMNDFSKISKDETWYPFYQSWIFSSKNILNIYRPLGNFKFLHAHFA